MPIQDIVPGTSPEAPGTWYFYKQGSADTSGAQITTEGDATFAGDVTVDGTITGTVAPTVPVDLEGAATTTDVLTADVTGDTQKRFILNAGGGLDFGPGNGAVDVNLYRGAVNTLQTDDTFISTGLTVNGATVLNEAGADADTRIEGDTDANLLFVDASTDRVGIGTASPSTKFEVNGVSTLTGNTTVTGNLSVSGVGGGSFVIKSSNTARASTITPADDPQLTLAVAANATYIVEAVVVWTSGGGGFRADWTAPAGATMVWTDNDGAGVGALGTDVTFSATTGTSFKGALVVAGTAGSITLRWAQSTTNVADTTLLAGCYLRIQRVV